MNLKTKLAASLLLMGSASMAQATIKTYSFDALFNEPQINGVDLLTADTRAVGTFQWDTVGMNVVSMSLRMNASMNGGWTATGNDYVNGTGGTMLTLGNLLDQGGAGFTDTYFASAFKNANTSIYQSMDMTGMGGMASMPVAYDTQMPSMMMANTDGSENAFFKLPFMVDGSGSVVTGSWMAETQGINPDASTWAAGDAWLNETMSYGDCTIGSLMGAGVCMAGEDTAISMMKGSNQSLMISEVSAVPVPAAAWLFGGALVSLFGANRRKNVLPA